MIFEMMIQTNNSYDDILNMSINELVEFFEYYRERQTGTAKLTEQQKQMIEQNKIDRMRK